MIVRYRLVPVLLAVIACRASSDSRAGSGTAAPADSQFTARPSLPGIVFLGTSLTAGYGLADPARQAYPALIQQKLDSAGRHFRVINAGVSGESSAGALSRIDWLLSRDTVAILVIETGANDALRGQPVDSVEARIQAIIDRARAAATPPRRIVLVGMEALPNLGRDYGRRFRAIYPVLARRNDLALIPFLLAGVGGIDSLNQADGVHPTARGHRMLAENVWTVLEPITR